MTEKDFTYWAFLAYSRQDNCEQRLDALGTGHLCWADWLCDGLKTFSVPPEFAGQVNARGEIIPERIHSIFQDEEEQPDNASLGEGVRTALEQSKYLVVICSPRSARSRHVNEAVRYFKQLGRGSRILPIVVAGVPNATDSSKPGVSPDDECFVPAMRHPVLPDGSLDTARHEGGYIFADARRGGGKQEILVADINEAESDLEKAKIQLIAGLIGVGFNGLLRREQTRRFVGFAEAQREVRAAQAKLAEAQQQAREALQQVAEARAQAQAAGGKLVEAQQQAGNVESQIAEARQQAREAQSQLEAAWKQVREAQNKVLEIQNLPQEVKSQIQDAHNQVLEAQNQTRQTQGQLEAARVQAREAQDKFQELQRQVLQAQDQVQEYQSQSRQVQSQLEDARTQAQIAEMKVLEEQRQAREAQQQVELARTQAREAQKKIEEIQSQTRDVQGQIQAAQSKVSEAQAQARTAQTQLQEIEAKTRTAQRLMKVFAVMAALALLAAGVAANVAWSQRKAAQQALAKAEAGEALATTVPQVKTEENRPPPGTEISPSVMTDEEMEEWETVFRVAAWESWLQTDLSGAMDWLASLEGEELANVLETWSQSDPDAAANWVENLPDGGKKDAALLALIQFTKELTPGIAAKCCGLLTTVQPSLEDVEDIASLLAEDDPAGAVAWAQSLKDEATRLVALAMLPEAPVPSNSVPTMDWPTNSPADMRGDVTNDVTNVPSSESEGITTNAPLAE